MPFPLTLTWNSACPSPRAKGVRILFAREGKIHHFRKGSAEFRVQGPA